MSKLLTLLMLGGALAIFSSVYYFVFDELVSWHKEDDDDGEDGDI